MKPKWMVLTFVCAVATAGFAITGLALLRKSRQSVADNRRQISCSTDSLWALEFDEFE